MTGNIFIPESKTLAGIDEALLFAEKRKERRGHMGMSSICDPDIRTTWLKHRWSLPEEFSPRILRIFRLGHIIEDEVIAMVRGIPGLKWHSADAKGKQFNFLEHGGHVGGSMDGAAVGIPDAPKTWHVGEIKSAKDSSFKALIKAGSYKEWNASYFGQIQCYMGASGMERALVIVMNKDTCEIYSERIKVIPGFYETAMLTARDLLEVQGPPDSIYKPTDYRIKNYKSEKYQRVYWGHELPKPNCRNCKHATIRFDGYARWTCDRHNKDLTIAQQQNGCPVHLYLPPLMPARKLEDHGNLVRYKTTDGMEVWNSEDVSAHKGQQVYTSAELHAISEGDGLTAAFLTDPNVQKLRDTLGATFESAAL